ncbi:MAG: cysteine--tRNA ligase [Acidimicrobiia bacterium]|nr:cysteine--tRNA ligase [Acidimicrobiia bacterium]
MLRIYDTAAREIVDFVPRTEGHIAMYACGPTVYDHPHLGHARQAMTYDVARRYLEWCGFDVHYVANITDIDDRIIERAAAEGRSEPEVAADWEQVYVDVMDRLDILPPHDRPHATEYVDEMVDFISVLLDNGSAYATDSGVYLRVRTVTDYGGLIGRTHDDLAEGAGARVEVDETKEDPLDFALWKAAKPGEPSWPAPWGEGRPGWHIECVAMSLGILGDDFDLHGGGTDLIFPHHTNERAEAIAAGRRFSRYWMHNAMVNIAGEKMSKSLNNFTTVADLLEEHPLNARALRLLLLQTHYRKTLEINPDVMAHARAGVERIDAMARKAAALGVDTCETSPDPELVSRFRAEMDDDFGTPEAVAVIFEAVRSANGALDQGGDPAPLVATVLELTGALGLRIDTGDANPAAGDVDAAEVDALVAARSQAKEVKDFAEADRIRDVLAAAGIVVEDTAAGPVWRRA